MTRKFDMHGKLQPDDMVRKNPFREYKELMTDPIFLIGNGKSREGFDLERLRKFGTIIGCNALYRDFSPDVLICVDASLINEIRSVNYDVNNFCIIPANRSVAIRNGFKWRSDRFNTSGCFGMKLISQVIKPSKCYMLGMDGYAGNVYDSTINYQKKTLQNFGGVVSYYLKALQSNIDTMFINVNDKDEWPKQCHETGHYSVMSYKEFEKEIV